MDFIAFALALIIVITIHECAHAWMAYKLGDPTAKQEGRISLNPLHHLDLVGTLLIFFAGIGWGKPTPVNPYYFQNPKRDEAFTALAGPASNLILALFIAIIRRYTAGFMPETIDYILATLFQVSLVLCIFNMLPFPPLDGSKIIGILVPRRYEEAYENYLKSGFSYFVIFLLVDQFILKRYFGFSILSEFIDRIYTVLSFAIGLGV